MMKFVKGLALAAALSLTLVSPGFAQATAVSQAQEFLATNPTDEQIVDYVAALVATATPGVPNPDLAAALRLLAAAVDDPALSAQILAIADAVEAGTEIPVFAVGAPAGGGVEFSGGAGGMTPPVPGSPN